MLGGGGWPIMGLIDANCIGVIPWPILMFIPGWFTMCIPGWKFIADRTIPFVVIPGCP